MGLSMDDFVAASIPKVPKCPVLAILEDLGPKDAKVLLAALGDDQITHAAIASVLVANGHKAMNQDKVGRHRRGDCACAR